MEAFGACLQQMLVNMGGSEGSIHLGGFPRRKFGGRVPHDLGILSEMDKRCYKKRRSNR